MTSYTPRPYQQEAIDCGVEFLRSTPPGCNGLMVEPTGSGKSLIIAEIVLKLNEPAIVFQPSKEILQQNHAKFLSYGYRPGIFSASAGKRQVREITLATIGSVVKTPELFQHVKHILIDECHGVQAKNEDSMFVKFLAALPHAKVLGLTATPYRLSTDRFGGSILKFLTRTRPRVFHKVVHVTQNDDLFRQGYLAKLDYKIVKTGFRADRLRLNSTGADYTDDSIRTLFRELNFSDQIVRCVRRCEELKRGPVIVFTRFIDEARYVASQIPGGAFVTAETPPKERQDMIERFKRGEVPCLCNVGVLQMGFDYPELANVILARPTRSLALYYQMTGRVVRPHPSKETAFVIDMVGLVEKFGRLEDFRLVCGPHDKWVLTANGKQLTNQYFDKPAYAAAMSHRS